MILPVPIAQIEIGLMTLYHIRKHLQLDNNSFDSLKNSLNKEKMKKIWIKNNYFDAKILSSRK